MAFNYRTGLFRVWLVLSLFWLAACLLVGAEAGIIIAVPLLFGITLYLIIWAVRGFAVKELPPAQTVDMRELRQELGSTETLDPKMFRCELELVLNSLEAKYGQHVPLHEIQNLQQTIGAKLSNIARHEQQIVDQAAREGETIDLDRLRDSLAKGKATLEGSDREAYEQEMDGLLQILSAKYGSRIPIDQAYKIVQRLEAGFGLSDEDLQG